MDIDDEVQNLEQEIRSPKHGKIRDVTTLRTILREVLGSFEESLKTLPCSDRQTAESLYLQKVRKLTFDFHLAVITLAAKKKARTKGTREELNALLEETVQESNRLARLYKFL